MVDIKNYNYLGARGIHQDEIYKIGDIARPSKDWDFENDRESGNNLPGTSAVAININRIFDEAEEIEEKIADAVEMARPYGDGRVAIIAGNRASHGDDPGEVVIEDAIVIALM